MWYSKEVLPGGIVNGVSEIVLTKGVTGWVDLSRFHIMDGALVDIITVNGFTITSKVEKWSYIPEE